MGPAFASDDIERQLAGNEFCLLSANHRPRRWRVYVERECHVAFQDPGLGCPVDRCRGICARRVVAGAPSLRRDRRSVAPDHLDALACRPSCRLHRRSGPGHRAGADLGQRRSRRFRRGRRHRHAGGQRLRSDPGDAVCRDLYQPCRVRAGDLSLAQRSRRLLDFRAIKDLLVARCRRPHCWRWRRTPPACSASL
jgi:hypothetical protein